MNDTLTFAGDTLTHLTNGFGMFSNGTQLKASMFIDYGTIIELLVIFMVPVLIVLFVMLFQYLSRRDKYRLAEKAIESGVKPEAIEYLLPKRHKSAKKSLMRRIVWGGLLSVAGLAIIIFEATLDLSSDADELIIGAIILAIGVGLVLSFVFGRKILAHDIELEDREAEIEFQRRHKQDGAKGSVDVANGDETEKGNAGETTDPETESPETEEK